MFPYSFGVVSYGSVILLSLHSVFNQEYQWKTIELLLSSKHGRTRVIIAKITASLAHITLVTALLWIINLTVNLWFAGWSGMDWPIQTLSRYESSPYALLVWQYVLLQVFTSWIGCIAFGLLILYFSAKSKSPLTVFFITGLVYVLPIFIHNISDFSIPWLIKNLLVTDFMRVENLFNRHRFVNIGAWKLDLPPSTFFTYIIVVSVLLGIQSYRSFNNKELI